MGLNDYDIANISENNARHPRRVEVCCTAVLEQWLREIPSPTWGKLDDAVKKIKLPTNPVSTDKGGNHGYYYNTQTRGVLILISAYRYIGKNI